MSVIHQDAFYVETRFSDVGDARTVTCQALIDTGSNVTCITGSVSKDLELTPMGSVTIRTPSGEAVLQQCAVNARIDNHVFQKVSVIVAPSLPFPIIGWDILARGSVLSSVTKGLR